MLSSVELRHRQNASCFSCVQLLRQFIWYINSLYFWINRHMIRSRVEAQEIDLLRSIQNCALIWSTCVSSLLWRWMHSFSLHFPFFLCFFRAFCFRIPWFPFVCQFSNEMKKTKNGNRFGWLGRCAYLDEHINIVSCVFVARKLAKKCPTTFNFVSRLTTVFLSLKKSHRLGDRGARAHGPARASFPKSKPTSWRCCGGCARMRADSVWLRF